MKEPRWLPLQAVLILHDESLADPVDAAERTIALAASVMDEAAYAAWLSASIAP